MNPVKFSATVLMVKNIEISKKFYTSLLDQEIDLDFGKNITFQSGVSIWELRENHVIPQKLNKDILKSDAVRFELYFESEDLDDIVNRLKSNRVQFLHDIHEEPWGQRTMRFFDPDKHLIEIGEPLDIFIGRMLKSGMCVKDVHLQSSVPEEKIRKIQKKLGL